MTPAHDEPGRTEAQPPRTETFPEGLRYDAFISYSRHNLDVADKIERDLERFPLPRDIRKRLGRRHLNVFRDISDMTGNQLESAIEQKLEDSRTLVVLCSPAARSSKFVGIELTRFAQLRGSAQIVPALVGGEPNDDPGVDPADMAFPEALEEVLGSDPLAVDMRTAWTVRGRRAKLARGSPWVQLVAGIVGATTDDLTARIAKAERHRLQTAVALLAVVLVVVGSLGVFAWQKRGQAIRAAERVAQVQAISRFTSDIGSKPQRNLLLGVQAAGLATEGQGENLLAIDAVRQQLQVAGGLPLLGHPAPTRAASLSSDHRWLATGSDDGTIKLWHMDATDPTGRSSSLTGHVGAIHGLSFTPDGRWLVSGGADGTVRLWRITDDGASPGPVLAANRFGAVNAVAISPDGAWLAVGTQDGTTCIWPSTPDGFRERPCDVGRSSDPVTTLRFSPGSSWLATTCTASCAAMNAPVVLWDLKKDFANQGPAQLFHATALNEDSLLAISFGGDDTRLAVAYGYRAEVWDLTQPNPPQHVIATDSRGGWINAVALSPDNRWLATGSLEAEIHLTDLTHSESPPIVLKGHSAGVRALSFSDDSDWLASGSDDATARLWNMTDPTFPSTLLRGQDMPVGRVLFAPGSDPHLLVTVGALPTDEENARLWNIPDPLIDPVVLRGPPSPLAGMATSADGKWIAMSNEGGDSLLLWSTADQRKPVADLLIQGQSHSISFSRDGRWLAAKSEASAVISLWDLRNPSKAAIKLSEGSQSDYKSLEFSPDSRWLVSGTWGGDVSMWDVSGDNPATTPRHRCQQGAGVRLRPAFSPDGHYVATAANEWKARARLWDLTSPEPCADPLLLDPHKPVDTRNDTGYEVQFSPDSRWAATTSMDRIGRLWDLQSGASPKLVAEVSFDNRVVPAAFSPDNHWVAFGSWDKTTKLIDLTRPNATPVQLAGHAARILSLAFTPDGRWLATGSEDRTVRLWDLTNSVTAPVVLRGHEAGVFDIGFADDGRRMVTGALDGTVRIWRLKLDDLIDAACRVAGRELTAQEVTTFLGGAQSQHLCGR